MSLLNRLGSMVGYSHVFHPIFGGGPTPPPLPKVPNPNDAANAAQSATDAMRMRRGMLANIFAGSGGAAPVVGRTQLGGS